MDDLQLEVFELEGSPNWAASSPAGASPDNPSPGNHTADDERLDWHWRENEEDIVLGEQRRIAVYRNPARGIVIREENPEGESEDAFVVLRDDDAARALIGHLQREIGNRSR